MNNSQIEALMLSWLDDTAATYFTSAQTQVWINNAQREVQKQLIQSGENWYVQRVFTYLVSGTDTYSLPSDFLRVHKLEVVLSGTTPTTESRWTLTPVTLIQLDQVAMQSTSTPSAYNIRKNCFTMRPIPDINYKVYLSYSYQVGDLVNPNDIPDVPVRYHEYIAVLAALDGFIKDGRDMSQLLAKKTSYMELMKQDAQERNVDAPRCVVVTEDVGMGYLF